jgi:hypothetical protein
MRRLYCLGVATVKALAVCYALNFRAFTEAAGGSCGPPRRLLRIYSRVTAKLEVMDMAQHT